MGLGLAASHWRRECVQSVTANATINQPTAATPQIVTAPCAHGLPAAGESPRSIARSSLRASHAAKGSMKTSPCRPKSANHSDCLARLEGSNRNSGRDRHSTHRKRRSSVFTHAAHANRPQREHEPTARSAGWFAQSGEASCSGTIEQAPCFVCSVERDENLHGNVWTKELKRRAVGRGPGKERNASQR